MKTWLLALAIFSLGLTSCSAGVGVNAAPAPTPDVPRYSTEAAIGAVINTLGRYGIYPRLVRQNSRAVYQGRGIWKVVYDGNNRHAEWLVDETTGSVVPTTQDATVITQVSHTQPQSTFTIPKVPSLDLTPKD